MYEPPTESARYSGLLFDGWRSPVTAGTCLAAIGVTLTYWITKGEAPITLDERGFFVRPWTPITSTLAHGDVLHILFNLAWMWKFGRFIESRLGGLRTLGLYVALAVASAAAEYAWRRGGIGLSGVVYGQFGLLWIRGGVDREVARFLDRNTVLLFVAWFFVCALLTQVEMMPVANFAHLGGGLAGAAIGWTWNGTGLRRRVSVIGLAAALVLVLAAATVGRSFTNSGAGLSIAYAQRGAEAMQSEQYEEGLSLCQAAVQCDPTSGYARWHLGTAQVMTGSEKLGLASLREAARLGVDADPPAAVWLEWMHLRAFQCSSRAEWTNVERLANEMIAVDEKYLNAWYWLGQAAFRDGRPLDACTAFERVYELDPAANGTRENQVWAKVTRAQLALAAGDVERAHREVASGLELAPEDSELLALKQAIAKQSASGR